MALIVQKYGGTSMGSTERIAQVAKRVAKWARAGHQVVVVPSAMSGETNRLLALAKELAPGKLTQDYFREQDMLAATGEQASSALLAIALQAEVSLPPRPSVVMLPPSSTPWKPVMMTTLPAFRSARTRTSSMLSMRALV